MKEEKTEYYLALFDEFLDGTLSTGKEQEIKTALKEHPFLQDVLRQHVQARANIRVAGERNLKEKFANSFAPLPTEESKKFNLRRYMIPLLLAIGFALAAYFFFNQEKKVPLPSLAQIEDPSYDLMRSENPTEVTTLWDSASNYFSKQQYKKCLEVLNNINNPDFLEKNGGKYNLTKGVCQLKLEQYDQARNSLSMLNAGNPYYDQAIWYEALSFYYQKNNSKATTAFNNILNLKEHFKKTEAKRYLDQLKKAK